ncbi:MAG TPA: PDZ domain-containing protein [Candidatus Acidoferrales bacterium]|nr:PDZ domain-containing protein [Candidatus Acidoferrales bacterium]
MKRTALLFAALMFAGAVQQATAQIDARLLQYPAVSKTQIVFEYAGDLWVSPKEGGTANRLTTPPGDEFLPRFSPDGSKIGFTGNYEGNVDVYVIPSKGGMPLRITHHGYPDRMVDWYPDGKNLLIATSMESGRQRYDQFYKVSAEGGMPEKLPIPYGEFGTVSPDGNKIAYTPMSQAYRTWKRYRGGWAADIWVYDLEKGTAENITDNPANDEFPMWHGSTIYFLSDRGENERANIWAYDINTKQTRQITDFKDFDIHFPSIGPDDIVFENGGKLYLLDLATEKYHEVKIEVVTDEITLMPKPESVEKMIGSFAVSPDGKRGVFEARGDIFSVPAENGNVVDLTNTSGAFERFPAWSPNGRYVAYWSDRSGEYELTLKDMENPAAEKKLTSYGPGFRYNIYWSPDSKKIAFIDKAMDIYIYDLDKDKTTKVDREEYYYEGGLVGFKPSWSSDSRWLAYAKDFDNRHTAIYIYDSKEAEVHQVTSGYYNDDAPCFDPDGKYLYFFTNNTFAPVYGDMDNTFIYPNSTRIAAVTLTDTLASPLAPKDDTTSIKKDEGSKKEEPKKDEGKKSEEKTKEVRIDFEGIAERAVILPPPAGNYNNLEAVSGKVVYLKGPNSGSADKKNSIGYYDLDKREEKTISDDASNYMISADHNKIMIAKDGSYFITDVAPDQKLEKRMPTSQMEVTINPREEWHQIFNDVWRFERDYFYDPNMHGVDWNEMRKQYGALIDNCMTRSDVNYVIGELISEMSSSHTYRFGGDVEQSKQRAVGYLGIDWELANGAYRIKTIIKAAPWDSDVRSPLDQPGVNVKEGDYILAVNDVPIDVTKDPYAAFEGLAGTTVELTVNSKPSMDGARKIVVETMTDEARLRQLAWMESNRKIVDKETGGKIGYIYVQDTGVPGQDDLVRQLTAQFDKQGLIIDERFNSGGQIPDRFIEMLNRKPLAFWAVRDGKDWQWPPVANFGPKVMLINGWSGSGGDAFPDYFREAGLGPLIGMRTWGGLIGITGAPPLIDGGAITVPTFRMYMPDGKWFAEGHGVDPDIKVVDDPAQLARGIDPQLEKGIEVVMQLLKDHPPVKPERPAYEKR